MIYRNTHWLAYIVGGVSHSFITANADRSFATVFKNVWLAGSTAVSFTVRYCSVKLWTLVLISAAVGHKKVLTTLFTPTGRHSSAVGKALPSLHTVLRILVFFRQSVYKYTFCSLTNELNIRLTFFSLLSKSSYHYMSRTLPKMVGRTTTNLLAMQIGVKKKWSRGGNGSGSGGAHQNKFQHFYFLKIARSLERVGIFSKNTTHQWSTFGQLAMASVVRCGRKKISSVNR